MGWIFLCVNHMITDAYNPFRKTHLLSVIKFQLSIVTIFINKSLDFNTEISKVT